MQEDLQKIINTVKSLQNDMRKHSHTGLDNTTPIETPYVIRITIPGTQSATASNYSVIDNIPFPIDIVAIYESHTTAGTDGGAVTLQVEKLTGTQALDAGTTLLSTAFDLKGAINTVSTGSLTTTKSDLTLSKGDRIALKDAGVLTAVEGVCVTIYARIK